MGQNANPHKSLEKHEWIHAQLSFNIIMPEGIEDRRSKSQLIDTCVACEQKCKHFPIEMEICDNKLHINKSGFIEVSGLLVMM